MPSLEERVLHFLDNDLPHMQRDITILGVKMWFVLAMLLMVLAAILSPLVGIAIAGAR